MRQADINRVNRAKEHLLAALTQLDSIKWVHISNKEDCLRMQAKDIIKDADGYLNDIINIQDK